jgi:HlyD family secretion protein
VFKLAERSLERQQTLAKRGVTSAAALDTATRDVEVAKADLAVMTSQIESAKAQIAQREAALMQSQIDLDRTQIRSPINGTVISRTIDIGQTVAASLQAPELFKIAQDLKRIRIEAQVNEADVGAVTQGNSVTFSVDAYPERQFQGRVTQVRLAATELSNVVTYTVIIEAANDDRKLFPGMTANAVVESARKDGVLRISSDALRFKPREGTFDPAEQAGQRRQQMIDRIVSQLSLTEAQAAQVSAEADKMFAALRSQRGDAPRPPAGFGSAPSRSGSGAGQGGATSARGRIGEKLEEIVAGVITDAQRPAFEKWKAQRVERANRGAAGGRSATVWLLGPDNTLSSRSIRIGVADDQYTEVLGSSLKDGDKVVTRTRKVIAK